MIHSEASEAKRLERARRKYEDETHTNEDDESMWELRYSFADPVGEIRIIEDWSGEGNGIAGLQWLGGVMLCRYMESRRAFGEDFFKGKRAIELGAGCGLTSIYIALRGAEVILTDMDIEKCQDTIEINFGARKEFLKNLQVKELVWGHTDVQSLKPPFDIVLAGDCLYEDACIEPLLQTMFDLSDRSTLILLCGAVGPNIIASFNEKVDKYFERRIVNTDQLDTLCNGEFIEERSSIQSSNVKQSSTAVEECGQQPGQRALLIMRKKMI